LAAEKKEEEAEREAARLAAEKKKEEEAEREAARLAAEKKKEEEEKEAEREAARLAAEKKEEAEREAARLAAEKKKEAEREATDANKPKDELAELEDFFGKLNDDPYMDGLDMDGGAPSAALGDSSMFRRDRNSKEKSPSVGGGGEARGSRKGSFLFTGDAEEDRVMVSASDEYATLLSDTSGSAQTGPSMRELTKENNTLRAKVGRCVVGVFLLLSYHIKISLHFFTLTYFIGCVLNFIIIIVIIIYNHHHCHHYHGTMFIFIFIIIVLIFVFVI
jgi:hypothetical protein